MTSRTVRGEDALPSLAALRRNGVPIVMITAYDYPGGRIAELAGADVVLVGDSAANTVLGYPSTREVSVDELLVLTRAVRRAVRGIPVVGDLPFGSYEGSDELAVASARRFVDDAGCDAVKLEGAGEMLPRVRAIIAAGIPVVGHVGLLPQSVTSPDGYRARGRETEQALDIIADATALEAAGCAVVVVEAVPAEIGTLIADRLTVPVIGIGAGAATDGQVLVYHDLLGLSEGHLPRFVKRYANLSAEIRDALTAYAAEVRSGAFPEQQHTYAMPEEEQAAFESVSGDRGEHDQRR